MASKQVVGEGQLQLSVPIDVKVKKTTPKKKKLLKAVGPDIESQED